MDFSTQLITEVKKYTMLYNMNSQGYFNVKKKERIWNLIAKRLNSDANLCKAKWKSLRDMYMRFKKRLESGKPPANNRPWKYYEMLEFLDYFANKRIIDWETTVRVDKSGNKIDMVHRLIEEVRQYPDLYNRESPGYCERDSKDKIWKEVSERINMDVLSCKQKWKGLRDSFKRFHRKAHRTDVPRWKYYDNLSFLEEFPCYRSKLSNSIASTNDSSMSPTFEELDDNSAIATNNPIIAMENVHECQLDTNSSIEEEYIALTEEIESTSPQLDIKESYILDTKVDVFTLPETNSNEFMCLDFQSATTNACTDEEELDKNRIKDEHPEEVPILYLRSDIDDDSSGDSLSIVSEKGYHSYNKQQSETDFIHIFKNSLDEYAANNVQKSTQSKDSVDILFDSLAYSIKNSHLPEDNLMALQADICAYAYGQLAEYKAMHKRSKRK